MDNELLEKLNQFTRRELNEDEVYTFDVVLCDNDIDRDNEAFSDGALDTLQRLYVGKTGIFDHNPKGANQTSRIFDTKVITDDTKVTKYNKPYKYLKANAYMVKTSSNEDLIKEIDGGIKKEVSVSCSSDSCRCSICGTERHKKGCNHILGNYYGGKLCYAILDDIKDVYEWSFVAVPSQVNAGVTKRFRDFEPSEEPSEYVGVPSMDSFYETLKEDIVRLGFLNNSITSGEVLERQLGSMSLDELMLTRKSLLVSTPESIEVTSQLGVSRQANHELIDEFRLKG